MEHVNEADFRNEIMEAIALGITNEQREELEDLEAFALMFKEQRMILGYTQADVGLALGARFGTEFSQTTISRFEIMTKMRPKLADWLFEVQQARELGASDPTTERLRALNKGSLVIRRRKRTTIDQSQKATLEAYFSKCSKPSIEKIKGIASVLELEQEVVRVWFCNKRQKIRREQQNAPVIQSNQLFNSLMALAQGDNLTEP